MRKTRVTLTTDEVLDSMKYGAWPHCPTVPLGKMTVTHRQGTPAQALTYTFINYSGLKANNPGMENVQKLKPDGQLTQGTTQSGPRKLLGASVVGCLKTTPLDSKSVHSLGTC